VEGGVEGGVPGGVIGGVVGGVVGGVLGGQVGGTGTDVLPFGAGMTRPEKMSGPAPQYTREALEARVQGLMIVKCVITTEGAIERCRIIKPLPHMEQAVLDSLYAQRYKPVTFQGRPVQVDYTFNIRLSLPR
jgi:protein TonB